MKRLAVGFAIIGALLLAYCALSYLRSWRYQTREEARFDREPQVMVEESQPRDSIARITPLPKPRRGEAVALLKIPRLGLSSVVVEGAGKRELQLGPGHISYTPFPGEGGNFAVAGHRDTFFRALRLVRSNDELRICRQNEEFRYRVVSLSVVDPNEVQVLAPTGRETVTLITCFPFNFIGAAPKRFIVRAECEECSVRTVAVANHARPVGATLL